MYPPAAPRPTQNNTLKIVLILSVVVVVPCVALILVAMYVVRAGAGLMKTQIGPMVSCELRFSQGRDAMLLYAQDNGGRLPLAANWQDAVESYLAKTHVKSEEAMGMKIEPLVGGKDWGCRLPEGGLTGMAFNKKLSGKKVSDIEDKANTILLFEIPKAKRNASEDYAPLPNSTSPKFMGQPRGWATQPVQGSSDMMEGSHGSARWKIDAKQTDSGEDQSQTGK